MAKPKQHNRSNSSKSKSSNSEPEKIKFNSTSHPFLFTIFLIIGLFSLIALISFDNRQAFYGCETFFENLAKHTPLTEANLCGKLGATFAVIAFNFFGIAAFLLPAFSFLFAYYMLRARADISLYWKSALMFFLLSSGTIILTLIPDSFYGYTPDNNPLTEIPSMPQGPGGGLGEFLLKDFFEPIFGFVGTTCLIGTLYLFCFCSLLMWSPQRILRSIIRALAEEWQRYKQRRAYKNAQKKRLQKERKIAIQEAQERLKKDKTENPPSPEKNEATEDSSSKKQQTPQELEASPEAAAALNQAPIEDKTLPEEAPQSIINDTPVPAEPEEKSCETEELEPAQNEAEIDNEVLKNEEPEKEQSVPASPSSPHPGVLKVVAAEALEKADPSEDESARGDYIFPPFELLAKPKDSPQDINENYQERGEIIINELAHFNCPATLSSAQVGPTITRYEIKPGPGVKAEKILGLQKNVAMALQAQSARLASVSEHGTIGIEVPNKKARPVLIREILESKTWHENKMEIPAVLGKDVTGKPVLIDLAKMPHGLIAGSSGSGKSVCLNGIITSILYHSSPEDVRLVMVDPKVVELKVYNDAPHMLIPVITEMKRAPGALKWLIDEMERRYQLLEELGVRNIIGYNAKIEKDKKEAARLAELAANAENTNAFSGIQDAENSQANIAPEISVPRDEGVLDELQSRKKMSYIVCIIDEFADIMAQNAAEIETGVARLTAKARAAGIHLILATQRPDAKTVTGLIKANLGTRIALRVTSGTNSRIILDDVGAETLIGKGDMLVLGPGSPFPQRAQGVWVSEEEIEEIVKFLAEKNGKPKYAEDVSDAIDSYASEDDENAPIFSSEFADANDSKIGEAWQLIKASQKVSTSYLQRKLSIGYGRAAKIIDYLEDKGYIGPDLGPNKSREIYK